MCDHDAVEVSNLHKQVIHNTAGGEGVEGAMTGAKPRARVD